MTQRVFEIDRASIEQGTLLDVPIPSVTTGHAVLRIDAFALTANNVTYALFGDMLKYWQFFPAEDANRGRVPVWGFATVVASEHPDVTVDTRYFGYLPMAAYVDTEIATLTPGGFMEGSAHRRELAGAYNLYRIADAAHGFPAATDTLTMVFQPLFMTAFLIAELLADTQPGLTALVSSASSKTALSFAAERKRRADGATIGLTSPSNVEFTQSLDVYDQVVAYPELSSVSVATPHVFIDIAGDQNVRNAVHEHSADALTLSLAVGAAHGELAHAPPEHGPRPEVFFAPGYYEACAKRLGKEKFNTDYSEAWQVFVKLSRDWLSTRTVDGLETLPELWRDLVGGKVAPTEALVIRP